MAWQRISILIAPVLLMLLFASTLTGVDRLAFRDVSHFYLPLYDYVAFQCSQQWLPLWNPLDQTGIPLLGETTTAVLYPVRYVLFALPLSTAVAMAWYVVLHLILASLTARWAAIQAGASPVAASLAGIVYPLSGGVFFLYTNPPFLVGAAWLPLVLGAMLTTQQLSTRSRCLIAGPAMAMMILGGDPQAALHATLVAASVGLVRLIRRNPDIRVAAIIVPLVVVPLSAALLTAPQMAASLSWSRQSDRVHWVDENAWHEPPQRGGQRHDAFQFSLPPWHAAELLTPNPFGQLFPTYQRVSSLIPGDGRMWTPTIYAGLLAALALLSRLVRIHRQADVWTILAVATLLLSMGHYGVVWYLQQIPSVLPHTHSAIGGPYWLLYQFLPGYDSFRYPVKWLPLFSLSVAIVTACWIDEQTKQAWSRRGIVVVAGVLIAGLVGTFVLRSNPEWLSELARGRADRFWGPLDVTGAMNSCQTALLHSLVVVLGIAVAMMTKRRAKAGNGWLLMIAVLVAADVGYSSRGWIARADSAEVEAAIQQYRAQRPIPEATRWMRAQSGGGWPAEWYRHGDENRVTEVAASERLAWFGRWNLADRQAVLNNMISIRSNHMALFWKSCFAVASKQGPKEEARFWRLVRDWLALDGAVAASDRTWKYSRGSDDSDTADLVDVRFTVDRRPARWFQFHQQWEIVDHAKQADFMKLIQSVADGNARPIIHGSFTLPSTPSNAANESVQALVTSPNQAQVTSSVAGLITRPVFQDGHWSAEIKPADSDEPWKSTIVHQVSFVKQGIAIEPGDWQIRFLYRPWWLTWTGACAAIAWIVVAVSAACGLRQTIVTPNAKTQPA